LLAAAPVLAGGVYNPPKAGSGSVTSITCGAGLSGGTITTSGTCLVPGGGITNAMLVGTDITTVGALASGSIANGFGSIATANTVVTTNATAATSSSTGALLATGGLGVGGAIWGGTYGAFTGTTLPTPAAGTIAIGGEAAVPTMSTNGEAAMFITSTTGGISLMGKGSTSDFTLYNSVGQATCTVANGGTILSCKALDVTGLTAPSNGLYISGTNTLGVRGAASLAFIASAANQMDYNVATAGTWTIAAPTTINTGANTNVLINGWGVSSTYNAIGLNGSIGATAGTTIASGATGDSSMYFGVPSTFTYLWRINNATIMNLSATELAPQVDNAIQLGDGTHRISTIFGNNLTSNGTITFAGVTTGTNADFVCMAAGGVLTLQTTACTISSMRFKNLIGDYKLGGALDTVAKLEPIVFTMKPMEEPNRDPNYDRPQIGLSAENVAAIEPRCAIYEDDMKTPKSYRQECLIAVLVAAVQAQQREIEALKAR
jgi:hypothetical protein